MSSVQKKETKSRIKAAILALIQMPRMQSSSSQCCLCSIGVFMFLGGIIMIATGVSLCLNYNIIDEDLLLPEFRNDEGKKTVGIILICVGLLFAGVSVSVSVYYLCVHGQKQPSIVTPDDIKSVANGSVKSSTTISRTQRPSSSHSGRSGSNQGSRSAIQGARRKVSPVDMSKRPSEKSSGNQFSQSLPNMPHRSKHKKGAKKKTKRLVAKTQLEDIKELDTISRKTIEYTCTPDNLEDTPRSQSDDLDVASLNTSETSSQIPAYFVTDHSSKPIPGSTDYYNQIDSDDQGSHLNKQTMHHSHTSHENPAFDDEMTSTGSESTISKNILNEQSGNENNVIDSEQQQSSFL